MPNTNLPPFRDHHTHVSFYASLSGTADLSSCDSEKEAIDILRQRKDNLIFARGWKNNLYDFSPSELDSLPPVAISNISLHCFRINEKARERFSVSHPEIISHIDDQEWVEHNLNDVFAMIADYGGTEKIPSFVAEMEKLGLYELEDMSVSSEKAAEYMSTKYPDRIRIWAELDIYNKFSYAKKYVDGIKLFADGALGAYSAALSKPCGGGNPSCLLRGNADMREHLERAARCKPEIAIHAIGDVAIGQVLNAVRDLFGSCGGRNPSIRLEHAQMISREQASLAKKMGIILSMQPNFSMDSKDYADRLSSYYINANNPFRMLIDDIGFVPGKDLVFGSDGMPHGAEFAVRCATNPPLESQKMSISELIAGYSASEK